MSTWTAPITWSVGQTVTKAQMDAEIRDHAIFLKGALTVISNGTEADTSDTMNLYIKRNTALAVAYSAAVTGDANARWTVAANGDMGWGPGSGADVTLKRSTTNTLRLDGILGLYNTATLNTLTATQGGDANFRFALLGSGEMRWGDGTSAFDTTLYRGGADQLKTDDVMVVGSNGLSMNPAGYIVLTEITEPAAAGANSGRLFVVDNGSGKSSLRIRFPSGATQTIATEP